MNADDLAAIKARHMAVFERWFGPSSDGMSTATRRAIIEEIVDKERARIAEAVKGLPKARGVGGSPTVQGPLILPEYVECAAVLEAIGGEK